MVLNLHIPSDVGCLKMKDSKSKIGHTNPDTYKELLQRAIWMEKLSEVTKLGCLTFLIKV